MHLEILIEDSSGADLLGYLLPKLLGNQSEPHTWRVHAYRGIGRIPKGLSSTTDPSKRILLDRLPRLLQGYGKSAGIDAVVVVVDTDRRICSAFLNELQQLGKACEPTPKILFRLAIEEVEAWYLGDRQALVHAYPKAKTMVLDGYTQDSVCGTWELLADAIHPGGSASIKKAGWPLPGQVKHDWATKIGPLLDPDVNLSPSFCKFRDGLRRLLDEVADHGRPGPH